MRASILIPFILFGACAEFPALDGTISDAARQAPYPQLTAVPLAPAATAEDESALLARVAALQARANRLRAMQIGALQ